MEKKLGGRIKNAWDVLMNRSPTRMSTTYYGGNSSYRPDKTTRYGSNEKSMVNAIYNRLGSDISEIQIVHAMMDKNDRYIGDVPSSIQKMFNFEANMDQAGRAFRQDIAMSLIDEGYVAIMPTNWVDSFRHIKVEDNLKKREGDNIYIEPREYLSMRVAKIIEWQAETVRLEAYNAKTGMKQQVTMRKADVAIIENPFYEVMNKPNSTLRRLINKLNLLDVVDEQSSSGKLDIIIQHPFSMNNDVKKNKAQERKKAIEEQLENSKYGIAYLDSTEKVTQLNRAAENNLMAQIEFLTKMVYSQLGITQTILEGTADEQTMLNYTNRTIEPIVTAIIEECNRKFIGYDNVQKGFKLIIRRDPFKLVPTEKLAELSDKLSRNEIVTGNEMRQIIGMKPSADESADELRNKNLSRSKQELMGVDKTPKEEKEETGNEKPKI